MPYCATCRMEYREERAVCSDCGATLASGPMPRRPFEEGAWKVLARTRGREHAEIIHGMLESNGIECEIISKALSEMPVPAAGFTSHYEIWVPEDAAEDARRLMAESADGSEPCPTCGHLPAPGESTCEYCSASRS